jgi:hypothetical protein
MIDHAFSRGSYNDEPYFYDPSRLHVTLTAWLVFVIGLNLAGVCEFSSRFAGIGSTLAARKGVVPDRCTLKISEFMLVPAINSLAPMVASL